MDTTENVAEAPLVFTDSAAQKVKTLIEEEGDDSLNLRVSSPAVAVRDFNMDLPSMKKKGTEIQ